LKSPNRHHRLIGQLDADSFVSGRAIPKILSDMAGDADITTEQAIEYICIASARIGESGLWS
jgi:hypothetical protein